LNIALKTYTSFKSEVQLVSDLRHDVVAERWDMLIKERMESSITVREWCHDRNIKEFQKGCLFLFCGRRTDRIKEPL
jgi:transposase